MPSYMRLFHDAEAKLKAFQRIHDQAATQEIVLAAMRVINRNNLAAEFVDELSKPKSE